jgi:hypothetical protein
MWRRYGRRWSDESEELEVCSANPVKWGNFEPSGPAIVRCE